MDSNHETNYLKIGAFVLVGLGLMVFALLIFGSNKLLQPVVYVETYFEESIQGVSVGTPVKYRGLQIGYIENIAFANEIYAHGRNLDQAMHARSIYVKIAITSKLFTDLTRDGVKQFLSKEVEQGLRLKLVAQGLTGTSYLEFDYVAPIAKPLLRLDWEPEFFYVPSVPSVLSRLSENVQNVLSELKDVNFRKLFSDLDTLTVALNRVVGKDEWLLDRIDHPLVRSVQNLKVVSDDLRVISNRIKLKPSEIIFSNRLPPIDPNKL